MRSFSAMPAAVAVLAYTSLVDARVTSSGLEIDLISGPMSCTRSSKNGDRLSVDYRGTLQTTGEEFDSSYGRGDPFIFNIGSGHVIKGWEEGLLDMCIGQTRKLIIPPELAYGDRGVGTIPPKSVLVFETTLVDILGLTEEELGLKSSASSTPTSTAGSASDSEDAVFSIATAPATPPGGEESAADLLLEEETSSGAASPTSKESKQECQLLGPFALLVQGALGALALLTLVWKRWRETPKRPWKIFIFDVSKQVIGSMLTHVINLAISMLSSVDMANAAAHVVNTAGEAAQDTQGRTPNPCSFYLLNLGIDTTIGVPILYILLKVLTSLFLRTPLARPPISIKSGNYGTPPSVKWYGKQLLIYCIGLVLMKFCVLFLLLALPWLPWIGDWALRWTRGNEALEITFALFIFPLAMNAIQYWVIDNFIMDKQSNGEKSDNTQEYTAVAGDDEEEQRRMIMDGDDEDEDVPIVDGERERLTKVAGDESAKKK